MTKRLDPSRLPTLPLSRRALVRGSLGLLGTAALASARLPLFTPLFMGRARADTHFTPRAKRVVYLFMSGAPSQLESFDYKPGLAALDGTTLPDSVRGSQRLTTMTSDQGTLSVVAPRVGFRQYGESGAWVSDYFPYTGAIADKLCILRAVNTDAINHDPAITQMQTGSMIAGRPSMGAWVSYGLDAPTETLPTFTVLVSQSAVPFGQPLSSRYWGSAFLPAQHQGVQLRGGDEPVLYLDDGASRSTTRRERLRDTRNAFDALHAAETLDPAIDARIAAFELAHRMQTSVPAVATLDDEPASTWSLYGDAARTPGTFAWNCVMARRLLESDVRFVQLYHRDWDHHAELPTRHALAAGDTDRAAAALVTDLEQRGLLDDTIVIWGGEFGRTVYSQGTATTTSYGRDHHPRCFAMWLAGGGFQAGLTYGTTDDYSYNVVDGSVHVHDLHATVLNQLGFDHTRLTFRADGRDYRLTDTAGTVVDELLQG